jgi:hypothetical protein
MRPAVAPVRQEAEALVTGYLMMWQWYYLTSSEEERSEVITVTCLKKFPHTPFCKCRGVEVGLTSYEYYTGKNHPRTGMCAKFTDVGAGYTGRQATPGS